MVHTRLRRNTIQITNAQGHPSERIDPRPHDVRTDELRHPTHAIHADAVVVDVPQSYGAGSMHLRKTRNSPKNHNIMLHIPCIDHRLTHPYEEPSGSALGVIQKYHVVRELRSQKERRIFFATVRLLDAHPVDQISHFLASRAGTRCQERPGIPSGCPGSRLHQTEAL